MGEFIGIRFGRVKADQDSVAWEYRSHKEFDGIGGFADILRKAGEHIADLPEITHPARTNFVRTGLTGFQSALPRIKVSWSQEFIDRAAPDLTECNTQTPPSSVAWHVFSEQETKELVRYARVVDVTVNSVLVRLLDKTIRPDLQIKTTKIPWMLPVNLRRTNVGSGAVDTSNHSSAIFINTHPSYRFRQTHTQIYEKLQSAEHWSLWSIYGLTHNLPHRIKAALIERDRAIPRWNIGSFSNLGVWDQEKQYAEKDSFIFMPPVLRCQWIGAGCVTYQRKLALAIQAHPDVATNPEIAKTWMQRRVKQIKISLPQNNRA